MIVKEVMEIKEIIEKKKNDFKVSINNYEELNKLFQKKKKSNLILELKAQEILSDMMFLKIIEKSFYEDIEILVKTINQDFKTQLKGINFNLLNFDVIKEKIEKYFKNLKIYYDNKFNNINLIINKQDTDIDEIKNDYMVLKDSVNSKINNNEDSFKKIEKKYEDILIYIKNKISN